MTTVSGTGTSGTSGTGAAQTATPSGKAATAGLGNNAVDQDMFLKLLVAQLKYQDPSNPTDPSQFLSQTAQFTTVEKLNSLEKLNQSVYDSSRQQTAVSMIGKTVTYKDASGTTRTGLVTGASVGASTPNLTIGGVQISLDSVSAVDATTSTTTGSTGSGTSSS